MLYVFSKEGCTPCKAFKEGFLSKYPPEFYKVLDIQKDREAVLKIKEDLNIPDFMTVPTVFYNKEGKGLFGNPFQQLDEIKKIMK